MTRRVPIKLPILAKVQIRLHQNPGHVPGPSDGTRTGPKRKHHVFQCYTTRLYVVHVPRSIPQAENVQVQVS